MLNDFGGLHIFYIVNIWSDFAPEIMAPYVSEIYIKI